MAPLSREKPPNAVSCPLLSLTRSPGAVPLARTLQNPPAASHLRASLRPPPRDFLLAAQLGPRTRRRARLGLQAPLGRRAPRYGSGPFPPPFSGDRRCRVGGTIPEEETAQGRTGLRRRAGGSVRRHGGPPGSSKPPLGGHTVPSLGLLSGLTDEALTSPQIPALLLTRKNPASILLPRSEIAPYPKIHRAAATEGGTGRESRAPGRSARRSTRPFGRHEAAPAQCGEHPPRVRMRAQGGEPLPDSETPE